MPKTYTEEERKNIRLMLIEEAEKALFHGGVESVSVDELVRRVSIPKGTFYLFYPSKELLLFEVIQEQHELVNQKLYQELSGLEETDLSADKITDVIFEFYKLTEEMPIFRLMDSGEIELLVRKLPREVVEAHLREDTDTIQKLFSLLPVKKDVDISVLSAAFHAIYYATLHKKEIGEAQYDQALRLLIYGVVTQSI